LQLKNKEKQKFMSIFIEEPEANLFPERQKNIAYFLASLQKKKNRPELILSTHSPYILTSLNNLLFANQIIKENETLKEKVNKIIDDKFLIDHEDCDAYLVSDGTVRSMMHEETKLIDADEIDNVSVSSAKDFDSLLQIQMEVSVNE